MFSSTKLSLYRTSRAIKRYISKYSSFPNSDAISLLQDSKSKANLELNGDRRSDNNRWIKLNSQNNLRDLSTRHIKVKPTAINTAVFSKEESKEFMAVFPDIVRDLTETDRHTDISEFTKRFTKVLEYNVPTGKKTRGLSTVTIYKFLEKPENLTPANIRLASILGWCIELLHAFFLIEDDIMDSSENRRGALCWYKNKDVGLQAVNDGILLENSIYSILKKYFSSHPCYVPLIELFHDVIFKTTVGQSLDTSCKQDDKPKLDLFTMSWYKIIVKYKTGYYLQMPVPLAMHLANTYDEEQHRQAKTVLLEIGEFLQIQDDFLDCFGDSAVTGKMDSDIKEGKCSWLAVVALQRVTPTQRKVMEDHYGRLEEASVQIIRNLYEELNLPATYAMYEEESLNLIRTHIQQMSKNLPRDLFLKFI